MYYQDVSAVPKTGCNVLSANGQITNYNGTTRRIYTLYGNTYKLYSQTYSNYGYDTSNYVCYTDLTDTLQSDFDVYIPMYHFMAIVSALLVFGIAIYLFCFKWWRKTR